MLAGTYIDPATEYEQAAEYCARQGYSDPRIVHALLDLPQHIFDDIDANPDQWKRRVSEYWYAIAMQSN
jgi:hypothetical protein